MIVLRCTFCNSIDLTVEKSSLICNGCRRDLRLFNVEFIVKDIPEVMWGEALRMPLNQKEEHAQVVA